MKSDNGHERMKKLGITAWAWVGIIILVGFVLYVLYTIHAVLMPFLYALVFVYILRPIVDFLDKKGLPRILALLFAYLGLISTISLFVMYVGPILYKEGNSLIAKFPEYITVTRGYFDDIMRDNRYLRDDRALGFLAGFEGSFKSFLQKILLGVPAITASLFSGILNLVLGSIIAFYILKDLESIRTTIREMIPSKYQVEGMHIVKKIDCIVGGFLKGQALVALSVAVLSGIALSLLKLDYAILLGFIIGIFNIVPYLGPIIGGAPAVIIALGTSWKLGLIVIAVLLTVQQLDSVLISPRIMSQQVNLHPTVIIFAILVGGTLFGMLGMLIAIPIAAVGKALYLHFRERDNNPDLCELQTITKS